MPFRIEQRYIDEMIAHAREDYPNECCGLLLGINGRVLALKRCRNAIPEADRPKRYQVDSADLVAAFNECQRRGWEFVAIYHSHTHTEAYPSPTDVRLATWPPVPGGAPIATFPGALYVLVSLKDNGHPVVRAFEIDVTIESQDHQDKVREIEIESVAEQAQEDVLPHSEVAGDAVPTAQGPGEQRGNNPSVSGQASGT